MLRPLALFLIVVSSFLLALGPARPAFADSLNVRGEGAPFNAMFTITSGPGIDPDDSTTWLSGAVNGTQYILIAGTYTIVWEPASDSLGPCTITPTPQVVTLRNGTADFNATAVYLCPRRIPPDTSFTAQPANPTNSTTASFGFTGSDNVTAPANLQFECKLDAGTFAACTSPQAYSGLAPGSHTVQVRARDADMNVDPTPASYTWTVDVVAPETSITTSPPAQSASASATIAFASNEPGSTFACKLDGGAFLPCTSPQTYTGLADGAHTLEVRATDAAGNLGSTVASVRWTVDATAPDTMITSGPPTTTTGTTASFSFTGGDGSGSGVSRFECKLDNGSFTACTSPQVYTGLADGPHTFQVRAIDALGNIDATPFSTTWTVNTMPPATTCAGQPLTLPVGATQGTPGRDVILGTPGNDVIHGNGGDDLICGGGGDDQLFGDGGDDALHGDAGNDQLDGGFGDDALHGGDGDDRLAGGGGNDALQGDAGADTLDGDGGNDRLDGGAGSDTLRGGGGNDTLTDPDLANILLDGGPGTDTCAVQTSSRLNCEAAL